MSSIIWRGGTLNGIRVESRGVFTNDEYGYTYAGQCRDGYACGLGVATYSGRTKDYAEHGPDGNYDGRNLLCCTSGLTYYFLHECGEQKEYARVYADGRC